MKIFIEKIFFINRAPFERMDLSFSESEISVLSAVNGRGKTTILSHITDSFWELARNYFPNEFEGKENKYYRVSSSLYSLDSSKPSVFYIRFKYKEQYIDYLDIRGKCSEEEYNDLFILDNKIPYNYFKAELDEAGNVKKYSANLNKEIATEIFSNNLLTYFPSYRYELPGYLNDPYKVRLIFKTKSPFSGYLHNPIEVITGLENIANWLMDIVLDSELYKNQIPETHILIENLNKIITYTLISKGYGNLRLGVGPRGYGGTRIQIAQADQGNSSIYPSIFNMSSGEATLLALFGEILRQADNVKNNIQLNDIKGIVLIDEIDKHLHIKLQKEILPKLLKLFPNIQFIVSSHSPFLGMGLADEIKDRSRLIDLDNFGISKEVFTTDLYKELYTLFLGDSDKYREEYQKLLKEIKQGNTPLIITEGKTDKIHIQNAKEKLNVTNLNFNLYEISEDWGDSKLLELLEQLAKIPQNRKIIGIFDRDNVAIISKIESLGTTIKDYGNNVYAFCLPIPESRNNYKNISIEFYYSDEVIKREKDGRRLYFDNEIDYTFSKISKKTNIIKLDNPQIENEYTKKVFDESKMCELVTWIHSKNNFAELVKESSDIDLTNFMLIFEKIREIISTAE